MFLVPSTQAMYASLPTIRTRLVVLFDLYDNLGRFCFFVAVHIMSQIIDFFLGKGTDSEGRTLDELLRYNDMELEFSHDVIQWLFPLSEPSNYNCDAPILTAEDIKEFHENAYLQFNLGRVFQRFMSFCGLDWIGNDIKLAENFSDRQLTVWAYFNHNHLRLTRVLKCLMTLGQKETAKALYARLKTIYEWKKFKITPETFGFWTRAVNE